MHWRNEVLHNQVRDLSGNLNELAVLTEELAETTDNEKPQTNIDYGERPFVRTVPIVSDLIVEPWREVEKILESGNQELEDLTESAYMYNLSEKPVQPQKPPKPGINGLNQPRQFTAGYFREKMGEMEEDYNTLNAFLLEVSPQLEEDYGISPAAARSQYEESRVENCQVRLGYEPSSLNS
jgi:hypothetical protein